MQSMQETAERCRRGRAGVLGDLCKRKLVTLQ
jgi:hypothetical protein